MIEITIDMEAIHQAGDTVVRRDSRRGRNAQSFADVDVTPRKPVSANLLGEAYGRGAVRRPISFFQLLFPDA
jgi:hypothetical protein